MDDEDLRPRKQATHEIGQKLDTLSVADLDERIALLRQEITRVEEAKAGKQSALSAASAFFKT